MSGAFLPPLVLELRAKAGEAIAQMKEVGKEAENLGTKSTTGSSKGQAAFNKLAGVGKAATLAIGGAAVAVGAESIHLGVDFQEATTQLVTGAGESEGAIGKVRSGLLNLAPAVGQTPVDLAHGMYMIESAGYHGAAGLNVLKAAAEGAKIGGADMTTVSDGLTTAMNDYHFSAGQAAGVTSKLIATVGAGKTTMGDLSGALAHVLPFASSLKIGFNDIMGAMATMTGQGIHAADAATYLKFGMMSLANETPKGSKALLSVGLTAAKVHDALGTKGLSGTLKMVTEAVGKKFPQGSAGYTAAISAIVGGTRGMAATLALTGSHMSTFQSNIKAIGGASTEAGGHVKGWTATQKDLGTQIAQDKAGLEALGTKLGMFLIPKITELIHVTMSTVDWFEKHKTTAMILGTVIGGVLVAAIGAYIISLGIAAVESLASTATMVAGWIGVEIAADTAAISIAAATLGIGLAVAALVVGIIYLAKHWSAVWNGIKHVVGVVVDWIKGHWKILAIAASTLLLGPIGGAIALLATHWRQAWSIIKAVASGAWNNVIRPVFGFIKTVAIRPLVAELHAFRAVWGAVWGAVKSIIRDAWDVIRSIIDSIKSAISTVTGAVSKVSHVAGDVGHYANPVNWFADGGWTPGSVGQPSTAVVHGGEYVLSNAMLTGRAAIDPGVLGAVLGNNVNPSALAGLRHGANSNRGTLPAHLTSVAGGGGAAPQVIENHTYVVVDGKVIQKSVERKQLQAGLRRGGTRTYQPFAKGAAR